MLFNSPLFIFLFLPVALLGFRFTRAVSWRAAMAWLTLASLLFYAWWAPWRSWPILVSILFNYLVGRGLFRLGNCRRADLLLKLGLLGNLAFLGYFKYTNFFMHNLDSLAGLHWQMAEVMLPLGISFFTFTQIAYLVDVRRAVAAEPSFLNYGLFVTFFPHLIAGPIIHHKEMMPQFQRPRSQPWHEDLAVGVSLFAIGLVKKVLIADAIAAHVAPVFAAAGHDPVPLTMAWEGALAYTAQIYFDFAGYSDMAIGLARMFGIDLPINFNSPYKSADIIDFWRRWHITLSRFLRDYLYFPLGGNRQGPGRRYLNLLTVMVLGGLWHGANWTFILWGGLHGLALAINHQWRDRVGLRLPRLLAWLATMAVVIPGWVLFRAASLHDALRLLKGMAGLSGLGGLHGAPGMGSLGGLLLEAGLLVFAALTPNSQEILRLQHPGLAPVPPGRPAWLTWQPSRLWAVLLALATVLVVLNLWKQTEFLYYEF
ncbi:peptidoglycan O-acetyltransferase [mine drainage metagenome]|uniref:Peptidoglycan O-acetyltransferase n=1 Tax=mine drainage metagenome TaxID=410659 RepID=A0A1J5QXM6_9ZZZZ